MAMSPRCFVLPVIGLLASCAAPIPTTVYGKGIEERRYEITGQPRLSWPKEKLFPNDGPYLAVHSGDNEHEIEWRQDARAAKRLDSRRTYRFELIDVRIKGRDEREILSRILEGDHVVYDAAICEVHHRLMARKKIRVSFGTPSMSFIDAEHSTFPHLDSANGGCIADASAPQFGVDWVCDDCLRALAAWRISPHSHDHPEPLRY